MDINSEINLGESSESSTFVNIRDSLVVNNSMLHVLSPSCALCHRILSSDSEINGLEALSICGDCKFLLLEDLETTSPDVYPRSRHVSRRYNSSESMESMFSQQFSQMINLARQNRSTVFERDTPSIDGDGTSRLEHHTSSRTTPSGSRRWRRGFSDAESDGFDSLYGESESNASFRRYRAVNVEADNISYSAYAGDSDASVDGQSFLGNENYGNLYGESDLDSDTDIDPMNAGLYHWNLEDEEEGDSEWEEADIDGNALESFRARTQPHGSPISNGSNAYVNWRRQSLSPEVEGTYPLRRREGVTNFEETQNFVGDFGDYLDARGFEDLLDHLAETESSKRGAPPASASFVKNMPRMTINDEKLDNMPCAICKDSLTVGTTVNLLPCSHLYHPPCILPWLSARNTCPLCRYELPTDDKDYEARKRDMSDENQTFHIIQNDDANDDGGLDEPSQLVHGGEQRELVNAERQNGDIPRNRWILLAPIVSIVGISLILFFGNPSAGRICPSGRISLRREDSQRRWWSFF